MSSTFTLWGTEKHSYSIAGTTSAAVTAIINGIVRFVLTINPYAKITVSVITYLVNYIVQNNVKWTYTTERISYRWTKIPNVAVQQRAVERVLRTFYTDQNRTTRINSVTTTVYAKDYKD